MSNIVRDAVLNKTSLPALKRMMDLSAFRHKLIASNIANVTTPGYSSKSIDFDSELRKATASKNSRIAVTHPRHIPVGSARNKGPEVKVSERSENSTAVNDVDIDREMGDLAQNSLLFELGAKLAGNKFGAIKSAIRGRKA